MKARRSDKGPRAEPGRRGWLRGLVTLLALAVLGGGTFLWGVANGAVNGQAPRTGATTPEAVATATSKPAPKAKPYVPKSCDAGGRKPPVVTVSQRPALRSVNIGFEDLTNTQPGHLQALAKHLDDVDANAVQIAVGRLDWLSFIWPGHEELSSIDAVAVDGRDLVQEALDAFGCDAHGQRRHVTLSVDALLGRRFTQDPQLAGQSVDGKPSTLFGSVTAWSKGPLGTEMAQLSGFLAGRYHPDAVNVTELMFFSESYGADDKADYLAVTGRKDWPRTGDGAIDVNDPSIGVWRSAAVEHVMSRVAVATRPVGVQATMDINYPLTAGVAGRPDAGQDAVGLLKVTDGLNLWYYPGMLAGSVPSIEQVDRDLVEQYPGRVSVSLGLWFSGHPGISQEQFVSELGRVDRLVQGSVSVTPASMMTDAEWKALRTAWVG
ncbi:MULTISPECIES: hypothetical protein [Arthrobacter]|uniref:Uncharacterized protein n=2 Tax=Arthrobacter TaxID=1663 RepID=A0ABU9KJP0_9MICC|nr:hypothetical protein [Arthrobacter sp. YJM1]MDP5226582.1 hypothetical protein [Arthrobacter sp. YJM1]